MLLNTTQLQTYLETWESDGHPAPDALAKALIDMGVITGVTRADVATQWGSVEHADNIGATQISGSNPAF